MIGSWQPAAVDLQPVLSAGHPADHRIYWRARTLPGGVYQGDGPTPDVALVDLVGRLVGALNKAGEET